MEYLRNIVFYHRAKGEHPERKKSIKSSNKTTPEKTGYRSTCMYACVPTGGLKYKLNIYHMHSTYTCMYINYFNKLLNYIICIYIIFKL